MTLDAKENIIPLSGHRGRHTNAYHDTMLYLLQEIDLYANGDVGKFKVAFALLRQTVRDNPWMAYMR